MVLSLTAPVVRDLLVKQLPASMGQSYEDVEAIDAPSRTELVFVLKKRSRFLLEALNLLLQSPGSNAGTGRSTWPQRRGTSCELTTSTERASR